ncbi:response regulator [Corallincola platygyrae]|uniref:Response regulator n=1 Tax=Corallincola platygyrae TaxID=1193278 RepID=A0ABW4XK52_9GAMM
MTDHFQRYAKRRFLVIDDFSEFRLTVRKMLEEFGAKQIDLASNAEDAFALYSEFRHDVVISDFNLGDGKDGQQLLEELSQLGILRHDTLYLMASAENSLHMVMGALECRPDDYLTKPFTKNTLHTRIDRLLAKKQLLTPLLKALDESNYAKAEAIALKLQQEPKARATALRYLSEIYIAQEKWDKAKTIFDAAVQARPILWARLGLVKVALETEGGESALKLVEPILAENTRAVQAWDLKALAHENLGDYQAAQDALQQAINVSPRSLERLRHAALVADKNQDLDSKVRYLKQLTKQAKNSSLKTPEDFILRQKAMLEKMNASQGMAKVKIANELQSLLKEDQKLYSASHFMQWETMAVRAEAALAEGKKEAAKEMYLRLKKELVSNMDCVQEDALLTQFQSLCKAMSDEEALLAVNKQLENTEHEEERCTDNRLGLKLYSDGHIKEAVKCFAAARQQHPTSLAIAINLAQALLKQAEFQPLSKTETQACKACLNLSLKLPEDDNRHARVQQLVKRFVALREPK